MNSICRCSAAFLAICFAVFFISCASDNNDDSGNNANGDDAGEDDSVGDDAGDDGGDDDTADDDAADDDADDDSSVDDDSADDDSTVDDMDDDSSADDTGDDDSADDDSTIDDDMDDDSSADDTGDDASDDTGDDAADDTADDTGDDFSDDEGGPEITLTGVSYERVTDGTAAITNSAVALGPDGTRYLIASVGRLLTLYSRGPAATAWTVEALGRIADHSSLAVDGEGHVHVVFCDPLAGSVVYMTNVFGAWATVTIDAGEAPDIALDAGGAVHVVYVKAMGTQYNVRYATNAGGTWSTADVAVIGYYSTDPAIALDAGGNVHLLYTGDYDLYHAAWTGAAWAVESLYYNYPWDVPAFDLAADSSGGLHIAYQDAVYIRYAEYDGAAWYWEDLDYTGESNFPPAIAIGGDGRVYITYMIYEIVGENIEIDDWLAIRTGDVWSIILRPGWGDASIAVDAGGKAVIAFTSGWSITTLQWAEYDGAWTTETLQPPQSPVILDAAVDADGADHLVLLSDSMRGAIDYATNRSGTWTWANIAAEGEEPSIAVDSEGNAHIVYDNDFTLGGLDYATNETGSWSVERVAGGPYTGWDFGESSIAVDADDNVHICASGGDDSGAGLIYAARTGGAWTVEQVDFEGGGVKECSMAFDADGNVHVVYQDTNLEDLKYAKRSGGTWTVTTLDSDGSVGMYPSVAVDSEGHAHILKVSYFVVDYTQSTALYHLTDASGSWTRETLDVAEGCFGWTSLLIGPDGAMHAVYLLDGPETGTHWSYWYATDRGGAWRHGLVDPFDLEYWIRTNLSLDADGMLHAIYLGGNAVWVARFPAP